VGSVTGLAEQLSLALNRPSTASQSTLAGPSPPANLSLGHPIASTGTLPHLRVCGERPRWRRLEGGAAAVRFPENGSPGGGNHHRSNPRISRAPKPGTLPYKYLHICIHRDGIANFTASEILVFLHGMKGNVLTPANSLAPDAIGLKIPRSSFPEGMSKKKKRTTAIEVRY